jgi:hypothetical protein
LRFSSSSDFGKVSVPAKVPAPVAGPDPNLEPIKIIFTTGF